MRVTWSCLLLWLALAPAAGAQTRDPIGSFVVDVRALMAALPTAAGWSPDDLPSGTPVPSRGFGLEGGGQFYLTRLGPTTLGVGGSLGFARGTAKSPDATLPEVVGRIRTLAPQVSFNFGHRLGWSYLSAGYGAARFESESAGATGTPTASGWVGAVNIGGGARWFVTDHVGVGFDARWHRLSGPAPSPSTPGAAGLTLFHLAVGVSLQ